ncbi:uncharacterized protein At5g01610-like [Cicer arietinum]|uniref:Uncharacterized protein At5g01610-like n=1 Tax=Cicer arietinum TaxID=3827 RepID=A0A1S3E1C1_CICAR|nr:uncharacterized protein At5g01610-like [Cicer arietinum]
MHQTKKVKKDKGTMRSSIMFLCILVYSTLAHNTLIQKENLSVYEILKQYDFPVGILPQGATSYELNEKTGKFTVYFDGTCIFGIKSYDLKYKSTIKGVISKGKLSKLKGVSVKVELLWLKIVEVTRRGDDLQFSVGIASAEFSVENFLEIPQCGCGFDCYGFHKDGNFSSI